MSLDTLVHFYFYTIESILIADILAFGNTSQKDWRWLNRVVLQVVVKQASRIIGRQVPQEIFPSHCRKRAQGMIKDTTHPGHHLFTLLPSGLRYRSIQAGTSRLRDSFYPQAVRLFNS